MDYLCSCCCLAQIHCCTDNDSCRPCWRTLLYCHTSRTRIHPCLPVHTHTHTHTHIYIYIYTLRFHSTEASCDVWLYWCRAIIYDNFNDLIILSAKAQHIAIFCTVEHTRFCPQLLAVIFTVNVQSWYSIVFKNKKLSYCWDSLRCLLLSSHAYLQFGTLA